MIKWGNKYKTLPKELVEAREKAREKAVEYRNELKRIGNTCLADPKFKKYKETFEALERLTFDEVRHYRNSDPVQYAMVISNMLSELNTFEALITDVVMDANKKNDDGS